MEMPISGTPVRDAVARKKKRRKHTSFEFSLWIVWKHTMSMATPIHTAPLPFLLRCYCWCRHFDTIAIVYCRFFFCVVFRHLLMVLRFRFLYCIFIVLCCVVLSCLSGKFPLFRTLNTQPIGLLPQHSIFAFGNLCYMLFGVTCGKEKHWTPKEQKKVQAILFDDTTSTQSLILQSSNINPLKCRETK